MNIFKIAQVKKRPQVFIASQNNMTAAAAVSPVGTGQRIELGFHEVFNPRAAMAAFTKNPDLIYEV